MEGFGEGELDAGRVGKGVWGRVVPEWCRAGVRRRGGGELGRITYFETVRLVLIFGDVGADEGQGIGKASWVDVDVVAFYCGEEGEVNRVEAGSGSEVK